MRTRTAGPGALLVEVDGPVAAASLAAWARDAGTQALDVVPGAGTVLFDGVPDLPALAALVERWPGPAAAGAPSGCVEVPTVYDGADLEAVADLWGCSVDDAVARHCATEFVSAFCGFAPGFAYLAGLPAELAVPRLGSPRVRVPAGSVGLADRWCGVYPVASPGGWRLLGRTELVLWDPERDPPALLSPGTRVRFVPA